MLVEYGPILLLLIIVLGFVLTTMVVTHLLGPKRNSVRKDDVFECGIESVGNARVPFSVRYFLIAILFVVFDVEVIFFYPWAVNFKFLGWTGFFEMIVFTGTVFVGFIYLIKNRILNFEDD